MGIPELEEPVRACIHNNLAFHSLFPWYHTIALMSLTRFIHSFVIPCTPSLCPVACCVPRNTMSSCCFCSAVPLQAEDKRPVPEDLDIPLDTFVSIRRKLATVSVRRRAWMHCSALCFSFTLLSCAQLLRAYTPVHSCVLSALPSLLPLSLMPLFSHCPGPFLCVAALPLSRLPPVSFSSPSSRTFVCASVGAGHRLYAQASAAAGVGESPRGRTDPLRV